MTQKINYVHITNFKGIKELEVNEMSRFVAIFGQNGAGKSSFIEAIQNAIKLQHGGNEKIRFGENEGKVEIHFDNFIIKRILGDKKKLEVIVDGNKLSAPQKYLDDLFGGAIGDPQKFINLPVKEKTRYILDIQGKGDEYDKIEIERSKLFTERADVHRVVLAKEEEVRSNDIHNIKAPVVEGNLEDLQKELSEINTYNMQYVQYNNELEQINSSITSTEFNIDIREREKSTNLQEIERLKSVIKSLEDKNITLDESIENLGEAKQTLESSKNDVNDKIKAFVKKDPVEVENKIKEWTESNSEVASYNMMKSIYDSNLEASKTLRQQRKEKDDKIKLIEEQQNKLLEGINISYKLCVVDGVMMVNQGDKMIALDELNTATQLDIGIELCLTGKNKIKIITIENANALDPNALLKIKQKIEENNAQCFLETVYQTGYESITIEDGKLVN